NEAGRNALGAAFFEALPQRLQELGEDPNIRVVLLAARGRDFSVGLDLGFLAEAMKQGAGEEEKAGVAHRLALREEVMRIQRAITSIEKCPKPVIALVQGYCLGGGLDVITACDFRLASSEAILSIRETRMAIVSDLGTLQRLPALVSPGQARQLAYTGEDISAERAREIGLVNQVFATPEELHEGGLSIARKIVSNSPLAVQGSKAVLQYCQGKTVEDGLDYVATWNAAFIESEDLKEGVSAFFEKRSPKFKGR
ncbi:MAG: crotonase/enoyl-CoA hydratase family protein, partial [Deltaproteobacteria bacterium]|nr:crotonase/enoyl-CoA hydratase family protein [Deltaproteobacteria bacterium]